jgi:hypothetical protein
LSGVEELEDMKKVTQLCFDHLSARVLGLRHSKRFQNACNVASRVLYLVSIVLNLPGPSL